MEPRKAGRALGEDPPVGRHEPVAPPFGRDGHPVDGRLTRWMEPVLPRNGALNEKMPPSLATSQ